MRTFRFAATLLAWHAACAAGQAAGAPAAPARMFEWRPFLGPFHSLLLHYPIGFLTMAVVLEVYGWGRPSIELRKITRVVIWLSLITGIMSAVLGILRASGGGYDSTAVELHRWFGLAVPVGTMLTLWLQAGTMAEKPSFLTVWGYRFFLVVSIGLLVVAGHYGGNLTHGSKYLVQNAPEFVKEWLDEVEGQKPPAAATTNAAAGGAPLSPAVKLYHDEVRPILEKKCVQCHGPEKQKGKYRVDTRDAALAVGASGKAGIVPGAPLESQVIRLILLPKDHDDVMPPAGKEALTPAEIVTLIHWIQDGAVFDTVPAPSSGGSK